MVMNGIPFTILTPYARYMQLGLLDSETFRYMIALSWLIGFSALSISMFPAYFLSALKGDFKVYTAVLRVSEGWLGGFLLPSVSFRILYFVSTGIISGWMPYTFTLLLVFVFTLGIISLLLFVLHSAVLILLGDATKFVFSWHRLTFSSRSKFVLILLIFAFIFIYLPIAIKGHYTIETALFIILALGSFVIVGTKKFGKCPECGEGIASTSDLFMCPSCGKKLNSELVDTF